MQVPAGILVRLAAACSISLLIMPAEGFQEADGVSASTVVLDRSATIVAGSARKVADALQDRRPHVIAQPEALVPAFEQLLQASSQGGAAVHVLHFGDSHTATDDLTGTIRQLIQERFGDGGPGFVFAGHPFRSYRRLDVRSGATAGWRTAGLLSAAGDAYRGLGGISISTRAANQSVFLASDCDYLEIHYLQQPGGGDLALFDGDQLLETFSTAGDRAAGVARFTVHSGSHRFTLKTLTSRPVRVFGWVTDRESGVTYEAMGIDGVEASVMLRWDEKMFSTYLQRRDPGLVVLAYGTNEAVDQSWNAEKYRAMFSNLLQRIRTAAPAASILVIGPPDSWSRPGGTWQPMPGLDSIIEAQQAASRENGCAFWDARQRMGGTGSMRDWVRAGLAQRDYIHFTPAGYRQLARAFFSDMMRVYEQFGRVRVEISESVGPPTADH